MLLKGKGISIGAADVKDTGIDFNQHSKIIDETVEQVKKIFGEVRKTKKIPLSDLRKNVIPLIHKASDSKHLIQLLDKFLNMKCITLGAIFVFSFIS